MVGSFRGIALSDDCAELLRSSLWAGWVEADNKGMKWLFQDDYRDVLILGTCSFLYAFQPKLTVRLYSGHLSLCYRYVNFVLSTKDYCSQCNSILVVGFISYHCRRHSPPTPKRDENSIPNIDVRSYSRRQRIVHIPRASYFASLLQEYSVERETVALPPRFQHCDARILGYGTDCGV